MTNLQRPRGRCVFAPRGVRPVLGVRRPKAQGPSSALDPPCVEPGGILILPGLPNPHQPHSSAHLLQRGRTHTGVPSAHLLQAAARKVEIVAFAKQTTQDWSNNLACEP